MTKWTFQNWVSLAENQSPRPDIEHVHLGAMIGSGTAPDDAVTPAQGAFFGRRDHSMVRHACNTRVQQLDTDPREKDSLLFSGRSTSQSLGLRETGSGV
jgi:hypothetical protein